MKKGAFLIGLFLALATFSQNSQAQGVWKSLSEVTYKISKDNFGELYVPVFSENIKKLEGKVVEADGYIIPFEGMFKPTHIILSGWTRNRHGSDAYFAYQIHLQAGEGARQAYPKYRRSREVDVYPQGRKAGRELRA